jgi:hypothetical protein
VSVATYASATQTFTYNTATVFDTTSIDRLTVTVLSATRFVLCYRDVTAATGKCRVGSVSSGTVTLGTLATFAVSPASPDFTRTVALSSTTFVVVYSKFVTINKYGAAIAGAGVCWRACVAAA